MKSPIKFVIIFTMTVLFNSSLIAKEPIVRLTVSETGKDLKVHIQYGRKRAEIRIIDDNFRTYFFKKCFINNYSHNFNLQNFPLGNYYFSIKINQESFNYHFKVGENSLSLTRKWDVLKNRLTLLEKENVLNIPVIQLRNDRICLNLLNPENTPVKVEIYNQNGDITFEEKFKNQIVIGRAYNFENAISGNYEIVVTHGDKKYIEVVKNQK